MSDVSPDLYFPPGTFHRDDATIDRLDATHIGRYLSALDEPSLQFLPVDVYECYRLLFKQSFEPLELVRICSSATACTLTYKRITTGEEDWTPGIQTHNHVQSLFENDLRRIQRLLDTSRFWALGHEDEELLDGTLYICEGNAGGKYHAVVRQTPTRSYLNLCRLLLRMANPGNESLNPPLSPL